jgi:hypothetical protein
LTADRRYSGVHGLVVAYYVIMNTGTAVVGDVLPCDSFPTDGQIIWANTLRAFHKLLG